MKYVFTLIFVYVSHVLFASSNLTFFEAVYHIPVETNGEQKIHAWAGGLNNPQFSAVDLNNNGIEDMVIFDKAGDKILTFLNEGISDSISFIYAPEYEVNFPASVRHWMLMRDMSCNGIPDLLTSEQANIKVYRSYYDSNNKIAFEEWGFIEHLTPDGQTAKVFVTQIDVPGIADINGDGDLDILTFNQLGGYINYFENISTEIAACGDTLLFELKDDCWGNIFESEFADTAQLLDTCGTLIPNPKAAKGFRHPGSTLLPFDANNNGLMDLLLGDILFTKLNLLINGGTPDSAKIVKQDANFPHYDVPISLPMFPAAYMLDVNNNGKKDLIVSPNTGQISENIECTWLYKNVATDDTARFALSTKSFLVGEMIEVGEGAVPIPFDYTGNGVKDLIIANYGSFVAIGNMKSELTLFINQGTNEAPDYVFGQSDFADVSLLSRNQLHPAFGDLTGNGVEDMIVGDRFGNIHFFQNTAQAGQPANFSLAEPELLNISGSYAAPFLYDMNGNGLLDLIVGERNGNVKYYENKGTAQDFEFSSPATNNNLGQMDARVPGVFTGFAIPWIMSSGGIEYVLLGTSHGAIKAYQLDKSKLNSGTFPLITENYSNINVGNRSAPAIIANNTYDHLIVGNYRGGLNFYTSTDSTILPSVNVLVKKEELISIYPNPANDYLMITFEGQWLKTSELTTEIYDVTGKKHLTKTYTSKNKIKLPIANLNSGIYVLHVKSDQFFQTFKFVKK